MPKATAFETVGNNARELTRVAGQLYRRRAYSTSVHVAIAAGEESSKALMVFCRQHLTQKVFNARLRHIPKHRLSGAAYYLAGGMQTVFLLNAGVKAGFFGGSPDDHKLVVTYCMEIAGRGNSAGAAQAVLAALQEHEDVRVEDQRRRGAIKQEKDRVESIYVGIDQRGKVTSDPGRFSKQDARKYLEQAVVGLRALGLVNSDVQCVEEFIASLPRCFRLECYREAERMVEQVRKGVAA